MTNPDGLAFGEGTPGDEDTWREAARVTMARDWDANEADLIDQAIAVPNDELEYDR